MKDRNGFEQKETRSKTVEMAAKSWRLRPSVAGMWLCGAGGGKVGVGLAMLFHKGGGRRRRLHAASVSSVLGGAMCERGNFTRRGSGPET